MWKHAATQENLAILKKRGIRFVDPGEGFLACGTYAVGSWPSRPPSWRLSRSCFDEVPRHRGADARISR